MDSIRVPNPRPRATWGGDAYSPKHDVPLVPLRQRRTGLRSQARLGATMDAAGGDAASAEHDAIVLDPEGAEEAAQDEEDQVTLDEQEAPPEDGDARRVKLLLLERDLAVGTMGARLRDGALIAALCTLVFVLLALIVSAAGLAPFVPASGALFFTSYSFIILLPLLALFPLALVQIDHERVPARSRYVRGVAWFGVACTVLDVFELVLAVVDVATIYSGGVPSGSVTWQRSFGSVLVLFLMLFLTVAVAVLLFCQFSLLLRPASAPAPSRRMRLRDDRLGM